MFQTNHFYPPHIATILSELESTDIADSVLMANHSKTISDPILSRIYLSLNYPEAHDIPSKTLINLLMQEYVADFPPIDSDSDLLKLRGYSDNIEFFDDSTSLRFDFLNTIKDPRGQSFNWISETIKSEFLELEEKSLCSLNSEDTNATPVKPLHRVPSTTPRSRNGLKVLSWKVKEIVETLGSSTYQEVADCLVKQLDQNSEFKDEKNIRRRVYDALNVLIAVGIIKKDCKKVKPLNLAVKNTYEKIKKLQSLAEKFLIVKGLVERNKNSKNTFQNLFLPFHVIAVPKKDETPIKIQANFQKTSVSVKLDEGFKVLKSDDVLKMIGIEYEFSWLPKEVASIFSVSNTYKDLFPIYTILS
jgi:E2F/DP family winged-helix DNA-binding domain/Transcription factor DP